jgi:DNA-binding response OmpR family regulator
VVGGDTPVTPFIHVVARSRGHRVVDAADPGEALQELGRLAFDLVVLDLTDQALDEEAVLDRLRAVRHPANTPILVLSQTYDSSAILTEAKLGVIDHLIEPIDMVAIGEAFDRAFSTDPEVLERRRRQLASAEMRRLVVDLQEEAAQKD